MREPSSRISRGQRRCSRSGSNQRTPPARVIWPGLTRFVDPADIPASATRLAPRRRPYPPASRRTGSRTPSDCYEDLKDIERRLAESVLAGRGAAPIRRSLPGPLSDLDRLPEPGRTSGFYACRARRPGPFRSSRKCRSAGDAGAFLAGLPVRCHQPMRTARRPHQPRPGSAYRRASSGA